jgi:hypothetical protein
MTGYGPIQLQRHLGLHEWQFLRAQDTGLIPPPGADGHWPTALVDDLAKSADQIRTATGSVPDLGAYRAAEVLGRRLGIEVTPDAIAELARQELIPQVGEYKGCTLFCGRAIEGFTDRGALAAAEVAGRLYTADAAAAYLGIRRVDLDHLTRAGLLGPATHVRSQWQPRRHRPAVALYRAGDLDELVAREDIDWAAVRAARPGTRSPLATLPDSPVRIARSMWDAGVISTAVFMSIQSRRP